MDSTSAGRTVADILLNIKAVNFRPDEPYTLASGWASPVYIDCRKLISYYDARKTVTTLAKDLILGAISHDCIDTVAGGETAGIPYAAWIADALKLPMQYVRKQPKGYGRMAQIEGDLAEGQRVLLVEDLATDGGSKLTFVRALRQAGAICEHTFVVFFYGVFSGAQNSLKEAGVNLHYLCTWHDVIERAEKGKYFDRRSISTVKEFLSDPTGWSAAHGGKSAED